MSQSAWPAQNPRPPQLSRKAGGDDDSPPAVSSSVARVADGAAPHSAAKEGSGHPPPLAPRRLLPRSSFQQSVSLKPKHKKESLSVQPQLPGQKGLQQVWAEGGEEAGCSELAECWEPPAGRAGLVSCILGLISAGTGDTGGWTGGAPPSLQGSPAKQRSVSRLPPSGYVWGSTQETPLALAVLCPTPLP